VGERKQEEEDSRAPGGGGLPVSIGKQSIHTDLSLKSKLEA